MDIFTWVHNLGNTIVGDSSLNITCVLYYGRELKVFYHSPQDNLPGADDMPCLLLYDPGKTGGTSEIKLEHRFRWTLLLNDSNYRTDIADDDYQEPVGIVVLGTIVNRLVKIIHDAVTDGTFSFDYDTDTAGPLWPMIEASGAVVIENDLTMPRTGEE